MNPDLQPLPAVASAAELLRALPVAGWLVAVRLPAGTELSIGAGALPETSARRLLDAEPSVPRLLERLELASP